jgi:hypothetical protein
MFGSSTINVPSSLNEARKRFLINRDFFGFLPNRDGRAFQSMNSSDNDESYILPASGNVTSKNSTPLVNTMRDT